MTIKAVTVLYSDNSAEGKGIITFTKESENKPTNVDIDLHTVNIRLLCVIALYYLDIIFLNWLNYISEFGDTSNAVLGNWISFGQIM